MAGLKLAAFAVGLEIAPGVPILCPLDGPLLALTLKSGTFGGPGFFAEALAALGTL